MVWCVGGEQVEHAPVIWPWAGYVAAVVRVSATCGDRRGEASARIRLTVESPPQYGRTAMSASSTASSPRPPLRSDASMLIHVDIIPTPPRQKRLLWDQFHNIQYPPGFFPRCPTTATMSFLDCPLLSFLDSLILHRTISGAQ